MQFLNKKKVLFGLVFAFVLNIGVLGVGSVHADVAQTCTHTGTYGVSNSGSYQTSGFTGLTDFSVDSSGVSSVVDPSSIQDSCISYNEFPTVLGVVSVDRTSISYFGDGSPTFVQVFNPLDNSFYYSNFLFTGSFINLSVSDFPDGQYIGTVGLNSGNEYNAISFYVSGGLFYNSLNDIPNTMNSSCGASTSSPCYVDSYGWFAQGLLIDLGIFMFFIVFLFFAFYFKNR
jgi:hypothetical protein